jgi:hypothetical protein
MTQVLHVALTIQVYKFAQLALHARHQLFAQFLLPETPSPFVHATSTKLKQLPIISKMVFQSL